MRFNSCIPLIAALCWLTSCSQPGSLGVSTSGLGASSDYKVQDISHELIEQQSRNRQREERARNYNTQDIVSPSDSSTQPYGYRVGPGDVLYIRTLEKNQSAYSTPSGLSNKQIGSTVSSTGTLFYPLIGEVKVEGKTASEIRTIMHQKLKRYYKYPQVDVTVLEYQNQRIAVTGEVEKPGPQMLGDSPTYVIDAISAADGYRDTADLADATIIHADGSREKINLLQLYFRGDQSQNKLLLAGDTLLLPDNHRNRVFVMGEVQQQRPLTISGGRMSLADALADAGNVNLATSDIGNIYVMRYAAEKYMRGPHALMEPSTLDQGKPIQVFHLNAGSPDGWLLADQFQLAPRDIIYVATAPITQWNRFISQLLPSSFSNFIDSRPLENTW